MMLPKNWKYRHPMCAVWFTDILERLDYGNRFLKHAVLLTQLSSMPKGELIAVTFGSWTLISTYSACMPWFCIMDTSRPHEFALHNVVMYPYSTCCCSIISFENYIVSTHDLVSATPLDFWCVSIFGVAVTKIIKIHCINLFCPIYLFKVLKVCQNILCVKTLKLRLWIRV